MPGVTEQEIAQAKQMNLYQYMQLCEPDNFKPEGPGQFRHKGHSSLTFAEDGSWTYFKTKATGRTALNYLIAVEGVSFVEAVREINRIQGGVRPSFQPVKAPSPPAEKKPAKEFRLPKPDKNNYAATAYLRKRCIHPNVLTVCKQKKILYQTSFKDHPNCVFVGRDGNGEPNATAIPWCPGELNDGQYGHYDLDCTIYLTGYDRYTDPETQAPNGADGGTGNLEALAESCDAGTLTRTIIKQDQYGNEYAGNAVSARYTKTITLPNGANGFQGWYKDGEDAYGNVEWASLLYRMDWEELYGIVDGIKCRATGSGMTEEELRQLFASLNIDATTARGQVVAFALSCQGKFVYRHTIRLSTK